MKPLNDFVHKQSKAEAAEVRLETAELRLEARAAEETHRRKVLERELEQLRRRLTDR